MKGVFYVFYLLVFLSVLYRGYVQEYIQYTIKQSLIFINNFAKGLPMTRHLDIFMSREMLGLKKMGEVIYK